MPKSLIIGANGFIGSHLVDSLSGLGHDVTAFDRFRSGPPSYTAAGVTKFTGEFLSRADLELAVQGQDYVLHFLSTTTPATAESDPTLDVRTNVAQTIELLESCVEAGVKRFYFASTGGAIYGPQAKSLYAETDRALPISPYGIGKLSIEHYLRYFKAKHGLDWVSLRISNPYGTRQHPNRKQGLIPIALREIAHGRPVMRLGDGSMVRDYVYVSDLVSMIAPVVGADHRHEIYNMGSGVGHTVNDVLDSIARVTGIDFDVVERPVPPTFVDQVVLDTKRFDNEFGKHTMTALDDGVQATWAEIKEQPRV